MVIWRGYGIVVPIVAIAGPALVQLLVESLLGDGYWRQHQWPLQAAAFGTGALLWWLGRRLNSAAPRQWIDPASGIEFVHWPPRHSFFYVPVEWTGPLLVALMLLISIIAS